MDERSVPRPTGIRVDDLGLTSTEAFVLGQIDGALSLEEVAEVTGLLVAEVVEHARRLASVGAIEVPSPIRRATTHGRYATQVSQPRASRDDPAWAAQFPRRTSADVLGMSLQRGDAFLLSNVDGTTSIADLAEITGEDLSRVASRVRALLEAGAIELRGRPGRSLRPRSLTPRANPPRRPVLDDVEPRSHPPCPSPSTPPPSAREPAVAPPPQQDDTCDLDDELKLRIDRAASAPDGRHHYAVLGVSRRASGKEIQRAYFAIAATLHPDRHFGKKLGPYKRKLELVFRRATEAYEVLRVAKKREEYDAYLALTRQSIAMERVLTPVPRKASRPRVGRAAAPASAPEPPRMEPQPRAPEPPATLASAPTDVVKTTTTDVVKTTTAVVVKTTTAVTVKTTADLGTKSADLLAAAQKALVQGDAIAAANHYRLALHYADDAASRGYAESGLREARAMLVETHLKKARYEEKQGRFPAAVESYSKALDGRPDDPAICERLANALREEGADLVRATRLAELAVDRAPRRAAYRVTLALVYADAGYGGKALDQLERAAEIAPDDAEIRRMLDALRSRRRR